MDYLFIYFFRFFFSKSMHWTEKHDDALVKEILLYEPWNYKKGSIERGTVWKNIAESLNKMTSIIFVVDDRAVRDRMKRIEKKYIRKRNDEEKASGVEVEEESEIEKGVADIIQLFKDSDDKANEEKDKKKDEKEKELQQAEEFRRQSLETIGETSKRNGKRRKSNETIDYLREKAEQEKELKQQEMELRRAELEERRAESKAYRDMLLQQQENSTLLMQQQQQVNMALLQFLTQNKD